MRDMKLAIEAGNDDSSKFDDDGRVKRTGNVLTASGHIITAVIGSGVLALAWAIAQLGWIAGPIALLAFSVITWFTSTLLADCYRSNDGKRNYNYMEVVKSHLGGLRVQFCGVAQHSIFFGASVGYSITASISMVAIKRSICFHKKGHGAGCHVSNNPSILTFGLIQIVLSQIPNYEKLTWLSLVAALMSFTYSSIGLALAIAKIIAEGGHVEGSLTGIPIGNNMSSMDKMWSTFNALGNIAFAYSFSPVLIEIQDTIKSGVPENKVMKRATLVGITISTFFYMLCGILGYAAFGNNAPGNFLTDFGFYEPFWLVAFANLCIVIHLVGAYQVFCQPLFMFLEDWSREKWKGNKFINEECPISICVPFCGAKINLNLLRLVWRSCYVICTTILAMLFPFFNDIVGLIGALAFWPLTVYFPIEMYIARSKITKFSFTWIVMRTLTGICLVISLLAVVGSVEGLVKSVRTFKPFHSIS